MVREVNSHYLAGSVAGEINLEMKSKLVEFVDEGSSRDSISLAANLNSTL